jgi:hypothetical protein
MINLNSSKRNFETLSQAFYDSVKDKVNAAIAKNKTILHKYETDITKTKLDEYLEKNVEELIKSPLNVLLKKFKCELHDLCKNNFKDDAIGKDNEFKKSLKSVLFYEAHDTWDAYKLAIDLDINVCPYCNRTYITTLGDTDNKFVRGDFDHFLLKKEYPYLRFSFYNLIPCCVICNRNAKHETVTSLEYNVYPYKEGFNNTVFTYIPKSYDDLIGKGEALIDFLYLGTPETNTKALNNINVFRLKEQYSIHHYELNEIINKRRVFSDSYLDELIKNYPDFITGFEDAYLLAFGKDFDLAMDEKRPLSKFTRDIVEELGLIWRRK